ncbi:hypothetical protein [Burkholderia arboris]|uniref:hypothetical protein n=1 Tax=Burkholderia arboris TaxID=488730 RepID=UPI00158B0903|nr:hypothetical protein [Burkholderia arboris]
MYKTKVLILKSHFPLIYPAFVLRLTSRLHSTEDRRDSITTVCNADGFGHAVWSGPYIVAMLRETPAGAPGLKRGLMRVRAADRAGMSGCDIPDGKKRTTLRNKYFIGTHLDDDSLILIPHQSR